MDQVEEELTRIQRYLEKNPKVSQFLGQPGINRKEITTVINGLLGQGSYGEVTRNFFTLVADNGRMKYAGKIIESYKRLVRALRGEIDCVVTTARDVDGDFSEKLKDVIKKSFLKPGQALNLTTKVDSGILGGMVVELGDRMIDLSVVSKLRRVNKLLEESI